MRTTFVCLLSLVLSVAVANAAPAPFPKNRDADPSPSTRQVEERLRGHYQVRIHSIQPRGKRAWIVVGQRHNPYLGYLPPQYHLEQGVFLVKCQGQDNEGRPQLTIVDLESARRGYP